LTSTQDRRADITADLASATIVFLVALPLSLGVASVSNAPLTAGLVSSIISGLIVSWLSGARMTVSGPTVGLAALVMAATQTLGSFDSVLTAIVLAGVFQMLFGMFRLGYLGSFVPHSVIRGTLAAVGLIMILKQFPHALGWDANFLGDESFGSDSLISGENTFTEIYHAIMDYNPLAVAISAVCMVVFFVWHNRIAPRQGFWGKIPAALAAVVAGTFFHELFGWAAPELDTKFAVGHFIKMPDVSSIPLKSLATSPNWPALADPATWRIAFFISLFGSVETLLTVESAERYDPKQIPANANRELMAQGVGNILCGLIGGLPIAAGILRTTANIYGGARSRLSNFLHGVLLLVATVAVFSAMNHIPIAALSALIIIVASQLVRPQFWKIEYREGTEQFLPFIVTVLAIAFTDLLTGVSIGLMVGLAIVIRMNHHSAITVVNDGRYILVRFAKDVTFAHKSSLKKTLRAIPQGSDVTIDGIGAQFIDYDIIDTLRDFRDGAAARRITVSLKNLRSRRMSLRGVRDGKLQEPFVGE
jgi:MFS superfamily sulfate permease-like transporter